MRDGGARFHDRRAKTVLRVGQDPFQTHGSGRLRFGAGRFDPGEQIFEERLHAIAAIGDGLGNHLRIFAEILLRLREKKFGADFNGPQRFTQIVAGGPGKVLEIGIGLAQAGFRGLEFGDLLLKQSVRLLEGFVSLIQVAKQASCAKSRSRKTADAFHQTQIFGIELAHFIVGHNPDSADGFARDVERDEQALFDARLSLLVIVVAFFEIAKEESAIAVDYVAAGAEVARRASADETTPLAGDGGQ